MLAWCFLRGPVSIFQLRFPPWLKPLATQLVYNLTLLNNFLLGYTKMLAINVDSANVTCTNSQLTKANANNEAIHNAFRNGWH